MHSGPVDKLIREGIRNSATASLSSEVDAEQAFFVADLSVVYQQFKRWTRCLPGIEPFYAVKCNPDPYVLRLLAALGTGFDCASRGEISQVLSMGSIDPSRIIFANPCKALSFIRHAKKSSVDMMTFDNADELYKIQRVHPTAKLVIRILTDDSQSIVRLGLKFGAPLANVPELLAKAKQLGLDVIGVSFHVGSGCKDPLAFEDAVFRARTAFDMGVEAGYRFTLLDVGGGFEDDGFEVTASVLSGALVKCFGGLMKNGVRVIAEPGRFFVSKAFTLAANVIARRAGGGGSGQEAPRAPEGETSKNDEIEGDQTMYYINEGVYGAFNCILFDHQKVEPFPLTIGRELVGDDLRKDPVVRCSVWGPTCDSIDCVRGDAMLPEKLEVGDWLGFRQMGAYTICAASQFNGFERSGVVYTRGVGSGRLGVEKALVP
ncbi:ornithine decarboxylase [Sistotremastrum niveocremeum HHB9708]|uniref:ornithine decarboxylase n=1 Tax=Sistotremastrum niveocremeum HHB9708 TaxID=1314777 RepID=A0A164NWE9_9AGAM|nr:ornithine decarboxylase [Sistotremastrum niveocremeum HHB9708]